MSGARLSVEAMALAADPLGPPRFQDISTAGEGPLAEVARHVRRLGVPAEGVCMVAAPLTNTADLAVEALGRLGPPPGGSETLVLLQAGYDQEHHTVPLPRVSHETAWEFAEEFGVSHATGPGGCAAVFGLLARVLGPGARATVLIADHSEYGVAPALPSGVVVAVRVVRGPGAWRLTSGRGTMPSPAVVRRIDTRGPAGGWTQALRLLSAQEAASDGPLLMCDTAEPADDPWLMLEPAPGAGPLRTGAER
ncbi:hypothetical protein AB0E81_19110 [Streptomyces sp. NPDC033538]|uniref:hypothetical protein n=1 Tax=Streptomyces sp. NPDC033538 TaxID=3155367 RepID=UPI0033C9B96C